MRAKTRPKPSGDSRFMRAFLLLLLSFGLNAEEVDSDLVDTDLADVSPAESGNPLPARDDQWRFTIAFPMVWAPDINGKIRGGEPVDFEISFDKILDKLSFGMMFELYANRGPYGLAFRSNFMRVEDEASRSGLLDTRIRTGLDMGVNDLLASFRVHDKVRLVTGVRHVLAKMELDIYSTLGNNEVFNERIVIADDNKFDLLFGINFNHWFNDKWGLMLNSDLGVAGDNDRDFSADFRALYRVSDLNNFWFGFRYLQIGSDSTQDDIAYKVDRSGRRLVGRSPSEMASASIDATSPWLLI